MSMKIVGSVLLAALVGCASSEEESSERSLAEAASTCSPAEAIALSTETKGVQFNGVQLNGIQMNGIQMNGIQLNGLQFNGIRLNGIQLNGIQLNGVQFNGIQLNGPIIQGPILQGTHFDGLPANTTIDGAKLEVSLEDGTKVPLFIEHVFANPEPANADVALYEVTFGDSHQALCGVDDSGKPKLATAIANYWDATGARVDAADRFSFACQGAALYKCVASGYKPWKSAADADLHQACTRMIRADYCGDGTSFTKDGTLIDMGDRVGIQTFATLDRPNFAFEASWGANGATCISKTRYHLSAIPECVRARMQDTCDGGVGLSNRSATDNACLR